MNKSELNDKSLITLRKYIKGKKVLDIGCVGQAEKWARHSYIDSLKPSFHLGVDIVNSDKDNFECRDIGIKEEAEYLAKKYGTFEIVVMYDVVEHMDNVGSVIENLRLLTNKNTLILISTPNCISDKWLNQMKQTGMTRINPDHVHWFCYQTLSYLFKRYGYKSIEVVSNDTEPRLVQIFGEE